MNRREAISTLQGNVIYACENAGFNTATISLVIEALDLAIEALEREIEYGQMVVDYTKGEALESDDWEYTNTPIDTPTNDCISRQQAIEEIKNATTIIGWNKYVSQEEIVDDVERQLRRSFVGVIESLKPITPPGKVLAEIKVDTEEVVERIKEEYQLERTGKWIEDGYYDYSYYVCSNCGQKCETQNNGVEIEPLLTKYCPNCGANMRGKR